MSAAPPQRRCPITDVYDAAYAGAPNWDIGRPQRAFVDLAEAGLVRSPVLDVGCGTGDLAIYLARRGSDVLGVDLSALAIRQARQKARRRGADARFVVWDALHLDGLADRGFSFRTVVDSAMFHVLSDRERAIFVDGLATVLDSGGLYCVLGDARRDSRSIYGITPAEVRRRFAGDDWDVAFAVETQFERR
jgi:2-polyprenyl-3-methyl-5-hydroxy-6-metoxy-1,4-benzoquinol methylase